MTGFAKVSFSEERTGNQPRLQETRELVQIQVVIT